MFAADVLKVIYAPHKVFKEIVQNPKYWGPLLVILLFAGVQTGLYYAQYSRTYYEQTHPQLDFLTVLTDSNAGWTTTPAASITSNTVDILNTTFYGESSLQFDASNTSTLIMTQSNLNGTVDCGPSGFLDLYLQIKIVQPAMAPTNAVMQLTSEAGGFFQTDLTANFANASSNVWSNLTIPVSTSIWQTTGGATWTSIDGMTLSLTFPEASNVTVRMGGLFFRGLYQTPIEIYGAGGFTASVLFSSLFTFIVQWIALSAVFYIVIKLMKGPVTWKPLFVAVGFALITMVIEAIIVLAATPSLPTQIYYPFEFSYGFQVSYSPQIVQLFSPQSQATYNTMIAPALETLSTVTTFVVLAVYVWLWLIGSAVVKAIAEFSWTKSLVTSAASVVLTYILLSLLAAFGII